MFLVWFPFLLELLPLNQNLNNWCFETAANVINALQHTYPVIMHQVINLRTPRKKQTFIAFVFISCMGKALWPDLIIQSFSQRGLAASVRVHVSGEQSLWTVILKNLFSLWAEVQIYVLDPVFFWTSCTQTWSLAVLLPAWTVLREDWFHTADIKQQFEPLIAKTSDTVYF